MILRPVEFLYHSLSALKNTLYEKNFLASEKLPVPVLSVGNLSFGGTGKTPFILFLAEALGAKTRLVIVSRSYKASLSSPQKVDLARPDAPEIFGDEAYLLRKKLSSPKLHLIADVAVWSGPVKLDTARAALADQPQLILVDDGFSHRKLRRDFDLVLIDATKLRQDYWREGFLALKRAHAVVLTKTENADLKDVSTFIEKIQTDFLHLKNSIYFSKTVMSLDLPASTPLLAFCGLADPSSFARSLRQAFSNLVEFEAFEDHQVYDEALQARIFQKFQSLQSLHPGLALVTTEKDAVKMTLPALKAFLRTADYAVTMNPHDKESLLEKISAIL